MIVHLQGHVEMADFLASAHAPAAEYGIGGISNVLFDWSGVESWNFRPPTGLELQSLLTDTEFLERAAILHPRKCNRQAAWFAAFLRTRNCRVGLYSRRDLDRALLWLGEDTDRPEGGGAP
ncbi:hypothetical protein ACFFWD_36460 [Bradyrhizobium erythrophlei]|uniref:hypothetical protein n=1 Tax=Bradyrhizobium erythrophlei TaxID=1437360 RepID=UPI0035E8F7F0